jgi:CheY-like chemotaxis protein
VRDSGVGIPPELLGSIFDLFTQADRSLDRSQGGLGIGLTLVRRLVEMHGGSVEAHSEGLNQGSEFRVRLPILRQVPRPAASINHASSQQSKGPASRILVVDDNVDAAESLALLLRLNGHEVRTAHDGPAALEADATFQPDVVLLDIGLPGMDGYGVARRLREQPRDKRLTIIAATGYGRDEDRFRSKEAGFDHHLVKPVDPSLLEEYLVSLQTEAVQDLKSVPD